MKFENNRSKGKGQEDPAETYSRGCPGRQARRGPETEQAVNSSDCGAQILR